MNAKHILDSSNDSYFYMPHCGFTDQNEPTFLIVNLSDDIVVDRIQVSNQEDFSANLKVIHVEGSIDYPTDSWYSLGYIREMSEILKPSNEKMIRYLKLTFEGPEGDYNSYCTLTNLKVFGNSMNYVMRNALHELSSSESLNPGYFE